MLFKILINYSNLRKKKKAHIRILTIKIKHEKIKLVISLTFNNLPGQKKGCTKADLHIEKRCLLLHTIKTRKDNDVQVEERSRQWVAPKTARAAERQFQHPNRESQESEPFNDTIPRTRHGKA